uniref:U17-Hexatoxin-Hc1g_1 n=1 Tax=Hadronyche cerberea TaxID=1107879 RepID=A0A4Q8K4W1_HADCE
MKLLHSFVVITVLVAVAVALPSKTKEQIVAEGDQLVEDLVQYQEAAFVQKRAEQCSKQKGENCQYHCECCGSAVTCNTIYVGEKEEYICNDKTSDNDVLNTVGKGGNVIVNGFSLFQCVGLTEK